ncbi:MAG TPA: tetratricopeptide repeat protein, partial [Pyrinomonadaceae bacterium]|nr:tetratricopeptide repeat protein [Pyrinomonadaceae bacterium]
MEEIRPDEGLENPPRRSSRRLISTKTASSLEDREMVRKNSRIKDASLETSDAAGVSDNDARRVKSPLERLSLFLNDDEDDTYCSSVEAARAEMELDGVDPREFSKRIKRTVLESYARAQDKARQAKTRRPAEFGAEEDFFLQIDLPHKLARAAKSTGDYSLLNERDLIDSATREGYSLIGVGAMNGVLAAHLNSVHTDVGEAVLAVPPPRPPFAARDDLQALTRTDRLGLANTVINLVGAHESIVVRPFNAVSEHTAPSLRPLNIARREQANCVLDWDSGLADGRLIISAQLMGAPGGQPLGEKRFYDESFTDVYRIGESISKHIAQDLGLNPAGAAAARRSSRYTNNPAVYHSYNLGRFYWNRFTEEDFVKAISKFKGCIKRDPDFAEAYSGLADCYTWMGILNMRSPQETFAVARDKAAQALARNDEIAEAHTSLGFTQMYFDWNWKGAEERFQHAILLNPNYETAYQGYAQLLMALGRFDEALTKIDKALVIHPKSFVVNVAKGIILYEAGRFDESIEQFKSTIKLNPKFDASYYGHALALEQKGLLREAEKESRRAIV